MTLPLAAVVLLALTSAYLAWRYLEDQPASDPDAQRLGLGNRQLTSAQEICQLAAAKLKLHVVFVEQAGNDLNASAGAPWLVRFDVLDTMAIRACLRSGMPAGIGSGQHGASDWLFMPLQQNGRTLAVVGVAGPYCRRRLDPRDRSMQSIRRSFERYLLLRDRPSEQSQEGKMTPRLAVVPNGRATTA